MSGQRLSRDQKVLHLGRDRGALHVEDGVARHHFIDRAQQRVEVIDAPESHGLTVGEAKALGGHDMGAYDGLAWASVRECHSNGGARSGTRTPRPASAACKSADVRSTVRS